MILKRSSRSAAVAAVWLLFASASISEQAAVDGQPRNAVNAERQNRKIYKYSVVPGGVYSADEFSRARRIDRVVAAHYSDFDSRAAQLIQLSQDQLVYVSYRKADKVYWTKGRHKVKAGEAVVSDGKSMARSRCGNRLSKTPQLPVAKTEPADAALGAPQPVPSHIAGPPENSFSSPGIEPGHPLNTGAAPSEAMPRSLTGANNGFPTPSSAAAFPPISSVLGGGPTGSSPGGLLPSGGTSGNGGGTTGGGTPTSGGTTPGSGTTTPGSGGTTPIISITSVPEPASWLMFGLGLTLCGLRMRRPQL